MEKRTCPKCKSTWYSADTDTCVCNNCGGKILPSFLYDKNVTTDKNATAVGHHLYYISYKKLIPAQNIDHNQPPKGNR